MTIATWSGLDRTPGYEAMVKLITDELGEEATNALRAPFPNSGTSRTSGGY